MILYILIPLLVGAKDNSTLALDEIVESIPIIDTSKPLMLLSLDSYKELIPLLLSGLLCGLIGHITSNSETEPRDSKGLSDPQISTPQIPKWRSWRNVFFDIFACALFCCIVFAILSATDLPYLARVGIANAAAFFGIRGTQEKLKDLLYFIKEFRKS